MLLSGGLDSAVLVAEEAASGDVQPIYVSVGLAWEEAERAVVSQLLASPAVRGRVRPLVSLTVDMRDVYAATHWAVQGRPPAYHTPDEDVYLPGRNIILLGKAGGLLRRGAARPPRASARWRTIRFPTRRRQFRAAMARALSLGLAHRCGSTRRTRPPSKAEVVRRGTRAGRAARADVVVHEPAQSRRQSRPRSTAACAASAASGTTRSWSCRIADPTAYASTANLA